MSACSYWITTKSWFSRKYNRKRLGLLLCVALVLTTLMNIWRASVLRRGMSTRDKRNEYLNSNTLRGMLNAVEISSGFKKRNSDLHSSPIDDDVIKSDDNIDAIVITDFAGKTSVGTDHREIDVREVSLNGINQEDKIPTPSELINKDEIVPWLTWFNKTTQNGAYVKIPKQTKNLRELNIMVNHQDRKPHVFNRTFLGKGMKMHKEIWVQADKSLKIQKSNKIQFHQINGFGPDNFGNQNNSKRIKYDSIKETYRNNVMAGKHRTEGGRVNFINNFRNFEFKHSQPHVRMQNNDVKSKHRYYPNKKTTKRTVNEYQNSALNTSQLPFSEFYYPLDVDMQELVRTFRIHGEVKEKPLFTYPYDFSFLPGSKCKHDTFLVFLIKSAPGNFDRRNAIRHTWGNSVMLKRFNINLLFTIAHAENQNVTLALKFEYFIYKDILQMSFVDNYYNNTLKTIGAVHWVAKYCNNAKVVVVVDDDMFVSTDRLIRFIQNKKILSTKPYLGGHITNPNPQRGITDKFYVSVEDYPFERYPDLVSGGFMVMNMEFVINLHIASYFTKKFIYDDVYVGIVAYKLNIIPQTIPKIYMTSINPESFFFRYTIAAHGFSAKMLYYAWDMYTGKF